MYIGQFAQKHGDVLRLPLADADGIPNAGKAQEKLGPLVAGTFPEGIVLARGSEADYVLLSLGDTVLGVAMTRGGLVAVDARLRSPGHNVDVQLAAKEDTRVPRLDVGLSHRLGSEVVYVPGATIAEGPKIKTQLGPQEYFDSEILPKFHPINSVRPSYWTENRLAIQSGESEGTSETLTIRTDYTLPLVIFALNRSDAVVFRSDESLSLSSGEINLNEVHSTHVRLQEIPS